MDTAVRKASKKRSNSLPFELSSPTGHENNEFSITEVTLGPPVAIFDEPEDFGDAIEEVQPQDDSRPEVAQQIEALSATILENALDIKRALERVLEHHGRTRNILAFKGRADAQKLRQVVGTAVTHVNRLSDLSQIVPALPSLQLVEECSLTVVLGFIERISGLVNKLRGEVLEHSETPARLVELLDTFNDAFVSSDPGEGASVEPEKGFLSKLKRGLDISSGGPRATDEASLPERSVICPLEEIMIRSIRRRPRAYQLSEFTSWGQREDSESRANALTGPMRSAYLFRSRKAPLHHEFALFCFSKEGVAESWVRVERAARYKAGRLVQSDSLGPLFGGVELRESISFATQKEELCEGADELASVITVPQTSFTQAVERAGHMHISELTSQLSETSSADPLYRLFTANCRWFARRSVLSVAQRMTTLGVAGQILWKGRLLDAEGLATKLLNDPFGGRQLAGARGKEIRAANLINLARTSLIAHRYAEGREHASGALELLQSIKSPTTAQLVLISKVHWYLGSTYVHRDMFELGLQHLESARNISHQLGEATFLMDESYADALKYVGRIDDAIAIRQAIIERWHNDPDLDHPFSLEILSNTLTTHASVLLSVSGRVDDALAVIDEAVSIRRRLATYRPDLHRRALGQALSIRATVLTELERGDEALEAASEAVDVTREVFDVHPIATRHNMALRLYNYATAAQNHGRLEDALMATVASNEHWKHLYEEDPDFHLADYAHSLTLWGVALQRLEREDEAVAKFREALVYERMVYDTRPVGKRSDEYYDERFANILQTVSLLLFLKSDPDAFEYGQEALGLTRDIATRSPHLYRQNLAERLHSQALCMISVSMDDENKEDPSPYPPNIFTVGLNAIQECVSLWAEMVDIEQSQAQQYGSSYRLLAQYYQRSGKALDAVASASKAFHILATCLAPQAESLDELEQTITVWSNCIDLLYTTDIVDGIPHAEQYLARLRELSSTHPDKFLEENLTDCLQGHAAWLYERLKRADEAGEYFRESITIARRLCEQYAPVTWDPYSAALARSLFMYSKFLSRSQDPKIDEISQGLEEALGIARNLMLRDSKQYVRLTYQVAEAYADALSTLERDEDTVELSAESIGYLRMLIAGESTSLKNQATLAQSLSIHAVYLSKCDRYDEAYDTSAEGIAMARELYALDPEEFRYTLAFTLNNTAATLQRVNRPQEALEVAIQALEHFRALRRRDVVEPLVETAFRVLLNVMSQIIDHDPHTLLSRRASAALAEAFYELVPDEMGHNLTSKLLRYAIKLAEVGQLEKACEVGKQALDHCRILFSQNELEYRPQLAKILDNLATDMLNAGQSEECLLYMEECATHYRALYKDNPSEYRAYLSHIQYAHAGALMRLGRYEECLILSDQAVRLACEEYDLNPSVQSRRALAQVYDGRAKCYDSAERWADACAPSSEAIKHWRAVYSESESDLPQLTEALGLHTYRLLQTDQKDETWKLVQETVELERELHRSAPDTYRERLTKALLQYAGIAERLGYPDIPLTVGKEVIALSRESYTKDPTANLAVFAERLTTHAKYETKLEMWQGAADTLSESLALWRQLNATDPKQYRVSLLDALHDHFLATYRLDRIGDALASLAERITGLRQLMSWDPENGKYKEILENNTEFFDALAESVKEEFPKFSDPTLLEGVPEPLVDDLSQLVI